MTKALCHPAVVLAYRFFPRLPYLFYTAVAMWYIISPSVISFS